MSGLTNLVQREFPVNLLHNKILEFIYGPKDEQAKVIFRMFDCKNTGVIRVDELTAMVISLILIVGSSS